MSIYICVAAIVILVPATGYCWRSTDGYYIAETIPYEWIDARAGDAFRLYDIDGIDLETFGFSFNFYGNNYSYYIVSTNGLLTFSMVNAGSHNNTPLPSGTTPNNLICAFWDSLYVDSSKSQEIYRYHDTVRNIFVIQWDHVTSATSRSDSLTFQIQLFPDTSEIRFMYKEMKGLSASGSSASVGIENESGTLGIRYESKFIPGIVSDGLGLRFFPVPAIPFSSDPGYFILTICLSGITGFSLLKILNRSFHPRIHSH